MKSVLFFATAAVALCAVPALAEDGQRFDAQAQSRAYPAGELLQNRQCFNGRDVSGANRVGANTLYIQTPRGGVYDLKLAGACGALDAAQKISVRANGGDAICVREAAEVVVQTNAGPMRCAVSDVRALSVSERTTLAQASRR